MGVGYLTGQGGGGSNVKSIQRGSVTPWNNTTIATLDIIISSIDISKSILIIHPMLYSNFSTHDCTGGYLKNGTTININRGSSTAANTTVIYWEVIEFKNVRSVQRGLANGNGFGIGRQVTLSTINASKCFVITSQYDTTTNSTAAARAACGANITSSVLLELWATTSGRIYWEVIEFN